MRTRRLAVAGAGAAVLLFGVAFGIGKAVGGDHESSTASGAKKVTVAPGPDAPKLASAGALPKLRPKPESSASSGSTSSSGSASGSTGSTGGSTGGSTATPAPAPSTPAPSTPTPSTGGGGGGGGGGAGGEF